MLRESFHFVGQNKNIAKWLKRYLKFVCLTKCVNEVHPFLNASRNNG